MFHSAFPYTSWYLHNCCDSQFCLHSLKEAKVCTLGKVTHQLAFSSHLLTAVLHMLYTQGSVKYVLKPWSLRICSTSLPHSPSPFVMHVSYPLAMTNPCSSVPLQTSSHSLLLQAAVPKPSLSLWLHTEALGRHGILIAQES